MEMTIVRTQLDGYQTLGSFYFDDHDFTGKTLELPWLNNKRRESCIPAGEYQVKKRNSPKYGDHFHVQDVPDRDYILIHHGNYKRDVKGCILPGRAHRDLNKDGHLDVRYSMQAMSRLNDILPNEFTLVIM